MEDLNSEYRQTRIECIGDQLDAEFQKYQRTLNTYKRLDKIVSVALGACSVDILVLTSGTLGSALTGIGIIASFPLGPLACLSATTVMVLTLISRRIMKRKIKHRDTLRLAQSKKRLVEQSLITALADDEEIDDGEFGKIVTCSNYNDDKDQLRQPSTTLSENLTAHAQ